MDIRRRRTSARWLWIWLAAISLGGPTHNAAAFDFSAERIVKIGSSVVTAHVNAKDDRWRFELSRPQGEASIIIVRLDRHKSWLILSKRRQYVEVPIAKEHLLAVSETMKGELTREFVGAQTLQGYPTELFEVTVSEDGVARRYYQWVTKAQRFPVKTVSKEGNWSEEFKRLIFTEQSPLLFELPQRLDRANLPAEIQQ